MLGNKQCGYYYWKNDEFMYFTFNGIHSSQYHLFIENTKGLTLENSVGESTEFSNAMLQEGTYLLGTSRKQKTFKRKCAFEGLTLQEYKRMMKWLTAGTTGELVFDSNPYWGWSVVLDSVGDATFFGNDNFLVAEFDLTFKTIGTYLAHSVYSGVWDSLDPDNIINSALTNHYGIPTILALDYRSDDLNPDPKEHIIELRLQNISNVNQKFYFSLTPASISGQWKGNYQVQVNELFKKMDGSTPDAIEHASAEFIADNTTVTTTELEYRSELATFYTDNYIAEENEYCSKTTQPNGLIELQSQEPVELKASSIFVTDNNDITINLDQQSYDVLSTGNYDYLCISYREPSDTGFGLKPYAEYLAKTDCYIGMTTHYGLRVRTDKSGSYTYHKLDGNIYQAVIKDFGGDIGDFRQLDGWKVYCGYSHVMQIKLTCIGNTSSDSTIYTVDKHYTVKVNSYNNL